MLVSPTINSVHGRIFLHTGADPAAGAQAADLVPARRRWRILSYAIALITDATVTDRNVGFNIDDGVNIIYRLQSALNHTASLTIVHMWAQTNLPESLAANEAIHTLPDLILPAGTNIGTYTTNIQAGDNFGTPRILIEEWIDP